MTGTIDDRMSKGLMSRTNMTKSLLLENTLPKSHEKQSWQLPGDDSFLFLEINFVIRFALNAGLIALMRFPVS